ncbi:MAG: C-terminal domain of CinA type protein Implicated in repair function with RecA and MutS [Hyphomicrobiales bacterium]|nr:C-terminal domain of CinA type protein Implicated in repair function with RecA and MutS [Hyphomicrobiales bacterium]
MHMPSRIAALAADTITALIAAHKTIVTAESCTGGLIAGALTSISGSSAAVYGGFITYANAAKIAMLALPEELIATHGAVSREVAIAMADGARLKSGADYAIAVTGIAGPNGGSEQKPVGLVHFACAGPHGTWHIERRFGTIGRDEVREETVVAALELVLETFGHGPR